MKINPGASKAVRFTRARSEGFAKLFFFGGDQRIPEASIYKFLGITVRWADQSITQYKMPVRHFIS